MNKKDLIRKVMEKSWLAIRSSDSIISTVLSSIIELTQDGGTLKLKWFWRFKRKTRAISTKLPMLKDVASAKTSSNLTFVWSNLLKVKTY